MRLPRLVISATLVRACACACSEGDKHDGSSAAPKPKPTPIVAAEVDAGVTAPAANAKKPAASKRKPIEVYKPGGFHVDDRTVEYHRPQPSRPRALAKARRIYLNLRSTPPGALAFVDGERIGRTPAFWETTVTGKPRDFTFILNGYALQRYRFVPVTNGTVHAKLERVVDEQADAGAGD